MPAFCGSLHCEEAVEFADLLPHVAEYKSLCASQDSHLLPASGNRLGDLHVLMQKRAPTAAELQAHAETIAAHWDQPIEGIHRLLQAAASKKAKHADANVQWDEKYRPARASEICGNQQAVGELVSWLKQSKDTSSRFDDSSDEEGNGFCSTFVITGPIGAGKSSLVHACAQDQGYNVLEVNASQQRSGRAIKALFGEAAQSRHLSMASTGADDGGGVGKKESGKHGKSKPAAKKRRKKVIDDDEESESAPLSLILFDEADNIFGDDKGFLSALKVSVVLHSVQANFGMLYRS